MIMSSKSEFRERNGSKHSETISEASIDETCTSMIVAYSAFLGLPRSRFDGGASTLAGMRRRSIAGDSGTGIITMANGCEPVSEF